MENNNKEEKVYCEENNNIDIHNLQNNIWEVRLGGRISIMTRGIDIVPLETGYICRCIN
jgi:hypothetical protein